MKTSALFTLLVPVLSLSAAGAVRLWETNLSIPTYLAAPPSPVPRFYEGRTYQGAKATFYPYPVQDVLTDVRTNRTYQTVFLENDYLQISVIPELGGRIWSAMDKANGYDFFYRQHVVKPALIGMLGAWISGGVEWNVPHHHRASSFMPVDYTATTNADGSVTIWVGEIELRHRMKWLVGLTLYPDRSYLELTCKVFNRTPFAWPMLFWMNPAVHANTNYQVLFPPGTEWTVQHGKPEFASWPIARQNYGGSDYTRGVDISWWKNHDTPKSFFAWNYEDDWFGGYDHGRQAGVIHWADHHVAPGKKFFEWGNGPEGEMWTKILTDDDGPYLELMAGAWSDNQPDYSWIQPGETREWKHWWYPIRNLGGVKAATRDAAVNLEVANRTAKITVNATKEFKSARVRLELRSSGRESAPSSANAQTNQSLLTSAATGEGKALYEQAVDLGPAKPFSAVVVIENEVAPEDLRVAVLDSDGRELAAYQPAKPKNTPMPKPVEKPKPPKDYTTTDELYFTGQRIEQLYSPSFEAAPYYEEILRRDPGDFRANTAIGILLCKQWRWEEAAEYLSNAVARATANYIRPQDGEAFHYLGVTLKAQGRWDEAREAFQKAVWSPAWQPPGYYALAEIACLGQDWPRALNYLDSALGTGRADSRTRALRAAVLRRVKRFAEAEAEAREGLRQDPLDAWAAWEVIHAVGGQGKTEMIEAAYAKLAPIAPISAPSELELALNYANAGLWGDATVALAMRGRSSERTPASFNYLLAFSLSHSVERTSGRYDSSPTQYAKEANAPMYSDFPHCFETETVLRRAMGKIAQDAIAPYLLGCLLYDNQPDNALKAWEESRRRDDRFALTHRNLALAYAQHEKNIPKAIASLEKAVELDPKEARFFYELDVQYEAGGAPVAKRLEMLTKHHDVVVQRDDALMREIVLRTVARQADCGLALLRSRNFRNWEGSSQIHSIYVDACLTHGQRVFADRKYREALREYQAALEYPGNLEVGRARRSPLTAQIQYLIGTAYEALEEAAQAKAAFGKAAAGKAGGSSESDFFHALALQKLGRAEEAKPIFERLVKAGEEQFTRGEAADYFAKFGERQSERVRKANAHYLIGLGHLGLGDQAQAEEQFKEALELHPAHLGALMRSSGN